MKNTTELQLPLNYVDVDDEEMEYLDGGEWSGDNHWEYRLKNVALAQASVLKLQGKIRNISLYDAAAEIYGHAIGWYGKISKVMAVVGMAVPQVRALREHCRTIEIEDHVDYRYYWAFRAIYACPVSQFF